MIAILGSLLPLTITKNKIIILNKVFLNKFFTKSGKLGPNKAAYNPNPIVIVVETYLLLKTSII
jgi:hypothetical protein